MTNIRNTMINKLNYSSGGCAGFSPVSLLILKNNLRTLFVYNLLVIINIFKKKQGPHRVHSTRKSSRLKTADNKSMEKLISIY
ncbi:hypothetical protein JO40_00580 [Treponema putidum]|nr:hypothetical protein JO40_00580 [Treponema putidum]